MTRKTRFIILITCVLLFLALSPLIVFYSIGYRFDFQKMKVVETGGIYVRSFPTADTIIIDEENAQKPGFFSNSVFVQNLLPQEHSITIQKEGYHEYRKVLLVEEKEVTKVENVQLFQKEIMFELVEAAVLMAQQPAEPFTLKSGSLSYAVIPENAGVPAAAKKAPILKQVASFTLSGNTIYWISTAGFLFRSDIDTATGLPAEPISMTEIPIGKKGPYTIIEKDNRIFVQAGTSLLRLDDRLFTPFAENVTSTVFSPDSTVLAYVADDTLYISDLTDAVDERAIGLKSKLYTAANIKNLQWLNNYYILFSAGNAIVIAETDARGQVNTITLPTSLPLIDGKTIAISNPTLSFDPQSKRLSVTTGKTTVISEPLIQ